MGVGADGTGLRVKQEPGVETLVPGRVSAAELCQFLKVGKSCLYCRQPEPQQGSDTLEGPGNLQFENSAAGAAV